MSNVPERKRQFCFVPTPATNNATGLIEWKWLSFVWYDPATGSCFLSKEYVDPAELERRALTSD